MPSTTNQKYEFPLEIWFGFTLQKTLIIKLHKNQQLIDRP